MEHAAERLNGWVPLCALTKSCVVRTRLAGVDLDIGAGPPVARTAYCPRNPGIFTSHPGGTLLHALDIEPTVDAKIDRIDAR